LPTGAHPVFLDKVSPLPPARVLSASLPACWLASLLAGWLAGLLACWLAGLLAGWLLAGCWLAAGWLAGWLCWLCWLPRCPGWVAVLAGWLLELREHGQEWVNWCWPGSYNKRIQIFTRRQTKRVLDCELPSCRTIGCKAA